MQKIMWAAGVLAVILAVAFAAGRTGTVDVLQKPAATGGEAVVQQIFGGGQRVVNIQQAEWAGHAFKRGVLSTRQYKTEGNKSIQFNNSGFYAPSFSMPRSVLFDVNLNQKIKLKVSGIFEGKMESMNKTCTGYCIETERYHFSEFGIYMVDENGNREGMRLLGTRDNLIRGNTRKTYRFTELTVENNGREIIVADSSGFKIAYSLDFKYVSSDGLRNRNRAGHYGKLNKDKKWFLGINCHVNSEGFCRLDIKNIQVDQG